MRKGGRLLPGVLLYMSASLLASPLSGFAGVPPGQDQPQRTKFYALAVVCEKNVQNAKHSLAAPDGGSAEILPGGQLVLLMENKLYSHSFAISSDFGMAGGLALAVSGSVIGKGGADVTLEGLFAWQDTQGKKHTAWIPLGLSTAGLLLFPPPPTYSFEPNAAVEMIRITNPGNQSLFVDAVTGYSKPVMN